MSVSFDTENYFTCQWMNTLYFECSGMGASVLLARCCEFGNLRGMSSLTKYL